MGRRVRTPTILQMEAIECGAACLGIVLGYFGRWVSLEELRRECAVSRDGSNAKNISLAAQRYGLGARGIRAEPERLEALDLPIIAHWNFSHFVVVEGFGAKVVHLNDPATGPRRVTREEFDASFTGVALVFRVLDEFRRGGQPPSAIDAIKQRLPGVRSGLLYAVLAGLVLVIPGLAATAFSRIFIDEILIAARSSWLRPLVFAMVATAIVGGATTLLERKILLAIGLKLGVAGSSKILWHVLHLPMQFFAVRHAGDVANRVALNERVSRLISGDLTAGTLGLVTAAFFGALLLYYDPVLALVAISVSLANILVLIWVSRRRIDQGRRLAHEHGVLAGVSAGGLQMIETLKATGAESEFFAKWAGTHAKVNEAQQEMAKSSMFLATVPALLFSVNNAVILGVGASRVMDGAMTMGMLVGFQALALLFVEPFRRMMDFAGSLQEAEGTLSRIDDVLKHETDETLASDPADAAPVDKLSGQVVLEDVSFGYNPLAPPLIEGFSLTLNPGQRVAIVGTSGSGKSTLAKLVSGLYQPWSGRITFGGRDRSEIPRVLFAGSLAVVDQQIMLFEGSVLENLTLWDPTVGEASVVAAAKDAHIHEDIVSRAGGYDAMVEEAGRNFSGGQRQRLEIARALVRAPTILVLDEATSALDPLTEKLVADNIKRRGCTSVIVAHRLSTVRDCDEIIVLDRGKVVERGTHEELMKLGKLYSDLVTTD